MTLEEKIEQLSQSLNMDHHGAHAPSQSQNQQKRRSQGWSRRCHKALGENSLAHSPAHSPPQWEGEEVEFNLGPPPELEPDVERFFHRPTGECKEDAGGHFPAEPPVEKYAKWIEWRGQAVDTPDWWWEQEMIPEVDDVQELAQKIRPLLSSPDG